MGKKFIVKVRGEAYEVEVEEVMEGAGTPAKVAASTVVNTQIPQTPKVAPTPAVATPAPASKVEPQVVTDGEKITAPIPGTILRVNVKVGDKVKSGDVVVVLEAMKLENEISTFVNGEVKQVLTSAGAAVNEGEVLIVIG